MLLAEGGVSTGLTTVLTSSATFTIPAGYGTIGIELFGESGYGSHAPWHGETLGGGGGSGGYSYSSYSVAALGGAGGTLIVTLPVGGTFTNATIVAGTVTGYTTQTAPAGGNGGTFSGGTAGLIGTGGNVTNSVGNVGGEDGTGSPGGAGVVGLHSSGNKGGNGTINPTTNNPGKPAKAAFYLS